MPKEERGRPFNRDQEVANGDLNKEVRSAISTAAPRTSHRPSATPKGASQGPRAMATRRIITMAKVAPSAALVNHLWPLMT